MSFSPAFVPNSLLSSAEGALVSIAIRVEPRNLEALLETLAQVDFPINPQIYHEAEILFLHSDGHEESALTTLVEFPAYLGRLEEVFSALEANRFDRGTVRVTSMLDELGSLSQAEPGGSKAGWVVRSRRQVPAKD